MNERAPSVRGFPHHQSPQAGWYPAGASDISIAPPPREAWGASPVAQRQGSKGAKAMRQTSLSRLSSQLMPSTHSVHHTPARPAECVGLFHFLHNHALASGREKGYHATGTAPRVRKRTAAAGPSDQNAVGGHPSTSFSEPGSSPSDTEVRTPPFAQTAHLHSEPSLLTTRITSRPGAHPTSNMNMQPPPAARAQARRRSRRSCHHDFRSCQRKPSCPGFEERIQGGRGIDDA